MNATFNIKVSIDTNNVTTSFGSEKIEDMDTTLLASVLKVFSDVQNRVKKQVVQFYGAQEQPEGTDVKEEEQASSVATQESGAAEQQ